MTDGAGAQATLPEDADETFKNGLLATMVIAPALGGMACARKLAPGTARSRLTAAGILLIGLAAYAACSSTLLW